MSSNLSTTLGTGLALAAKSSLATATVNSGGIAMVSGSTTVAMGAASATALCTIGLPLAVFGLGYWAYLATRD